MKRLLYAIAVLALFQRLCAFAQETRSAIFGRVSDRRIRHSGRHRRDHKRRHEYGDDVVDKRNGLLRGEPSDRRQVPDFRVKSPGSGSRFVPASSSDQRAGSKSTSRSSWVTSPRRVGDAEAPGGHQRRCPRQGNGQPRGARPADLQQQPADADQTAPGVEASNNRRYNGVNALGGPTKRTTSARSAATTGRSTVCRTWARVRSRLPAVLHDDLGIQGGDAELRRRGGTLDRNGDCHHDQVRDQCVPRRPDRAVLE